MQNEDTFFLQNLDKNPKETGLPECISKISHKGTSKNDNFRVGRGIQNSSQIWTLQGRNHRTWQVLRQVKMAKKRWNQQTIIGQVGGPKKPTTIGHHRVEIIGHGRYLQVKMAKKRRELSNLFVTSKNETREPFKTPF